VSVTSAPGDSRSAVPGREEAAPIAASVGVRRRAGGLAALGLAILGTGSALVSATTARGDSTPIGPLPPGPVSTITTSPNQLVAVALRREPAKSGLVWRLARRYDSRVVRQVSEADVGANVVLVFKVVGRGKTSLVFALTRGDSSSKALKSATHRILSR
jgi:hypothetical protein